MEEPSLKAQSSLRQRALWPAPRHAASRRSPFHCQDQAAAEVEASRAPLFFFRHECARRLETAPKKNRKNIGKITPAF
jgi:hypothetical protein